MRCLPLWICCGLLLICGAPAVSQEQSLSGEFPSASELKQSLQERWDGITSMDVTITIGGEEFADRATLVELIKKPTVTRGSERFAFKGDKRFLERATTELSQSFRQVGPADPELVAKILSEPDAHERIARGELPGFEASSRHASLTSRAGFDGAELTEFQGDIAFVYTKDQAVNRHRFDALYPRSLGLFLPDPTSTPELNETNAASALPDVLDHYDYIMSWDNLPEGKLLKLDGIVGTMLPESFRRKDTIWLDPQKGYMMARREVINPASGLLTYRITNLDAKEVLPGIWIPMKSMHEEFAPATAPKELRGTVLTRTDQKVTNVVLNDVPDSFFNLSIRPGALVADFKSDPTSSPLEVKPVLYQQPAGTRVFDEAAAEGRDNMRASTKWVIGVNLLVLAVIGIVFLLAKRRG